jgi:magnesium chelatase subunit I
MSNKNYPATLGLLKASGYKSLSVKEELRRNLLVRLRDRSPIFPGIVGYDDTVVPAITNALLAKHDFILLGLRGQAKTRLARLVPLLLDEFVPIIAGSETNDDPLAPISKHGRDMIAAHGDEAPITWLHRSERFGEKLATPDVTIADLIGDIDPIKAAAHRLHYAHEGAIHFGVIPRTNRGVFVINELPDLQPRIQVGLFNILQEKDIQIRGFNIRIPLDVLMIFTANPEDYTNRGTIITPLKDRIASQILTHYPATLESAMAITEQEAWTMREGSRAEIPKFYREIVDEIAFQARQSEHVDQSSGVSARLPIAAMEILVSNAERRAAILGDDVIRPRMTDVLQIQPGITGKVELVFEGEQEGTQKVAVALIGRAVRTVFQRHFPDPLQKPRRQQRATEGRPTPPSPPSEYDKIVQWFETGHAITLEDTMPAAAYTKELERVPTLKEVAKKYMPAYAEDTHALAGVMEFVLDALHQHSRLARAESRGGGTIAYKDLVGSIFSRGTEELDD